MSTAAVMSSPSTPTFGTAAELMKKEEEEIPVTPLPAPTTTTKRRRLNPSLKLVTEVDLAKVKVKIVKNDEPNSFGIQNNYVNYDGIRDLEMQLPTFLPTFTGVTEWENKDGKPPSITLTVQFPNVDVNHYVQTQEVRPNETLATMAFSRLTEKTFQSEGKTTKEAEVTYRKPTESEVQKEMDTFRFYVELEATVKKQLNIVDDAKLYVWNGPIQIRPKKDDTGAFLVGEYYQPSLRFNSSYGEVPLCQNNACEMDEDETGDTKMGIMRTSHADVTKFCSACPVHTLGRTFRKVRQMPIASGYHLYMKRLCFIPPSNGTVVEEEEEEEEKEEEELEFI